MEHGTFTPTRFTIFRGTGQENYKHHKHLAYKTDLLTLQNYIYIDTFKTLIRIIHQKNPNTSKKTSISYTMTQIYVTTS